MLRLMLLAKMREFDVDIDGLDNELRLLIFARESLAI